MKKKHQVNMQKILKLEDDSLLNSEGVKDATRLKVVQLDKISHVLTKKMVLVKSLASNTITGIVIQFSLNNPIDKNVSNNNTIL